MPSKLSKVISFNTSDNVDDFHLLTSAFIELNVMHSYRTLQGKQER